MLPSLRGAFSDEATQVSGIITHEPSHHSHHIFTRNQLAGRMDFDSIPLVLWESFPKPQDFTLVECGETGHWPNLENPEVFEQGLTKWLRDLL